ncbi:MAG: hypothetical protein O9283_05845 [Sphingomonadaceae bacterium]|nr:hypothetical protein [Sphingomonadaceae bacterium]
MLHFWKLLALAAALAGAVPPALTPALAEIPATIRADLMQGRALVARHGDRLWPGWSRVPAGFVLVTPEGERLLCDDRVPPGFIPLPRDRRLDCAQAAGPATWRSPALLAAMAVFGPPPVIVMGTPETTGKDRSGWLVTVLHERFHQWQMAQPGYYEQIRALDLSDGDETGMWMLNYPFPYRASAVSAAHAAATRALAAAIEADEASFAARRTDYLAARAMLAESVIARDWRYFEFQLWQEGVARWTELELARRSGDKALTDHARARRASIIARLRSPDLASDGRLAAYAMGAGEAMLLERWDRNWRKCYTRQMALGPLLREACSSGAVDRPRAI